MPKSLKYFVFLHILFFNITLAEQAYSQDETDKTAEYLSWVLLQTVPSPVFFQDADENNARIQFGFRWQVTPLNISFTSNRYISPLQFFKINPVRRFTGSFEVFIQPGLALSDSKYSNLRRFSLGSGGRIIFPVSGEGQNLAASAGAKYVFHKDFFGYDKSYWGIETGIYAIYGLLGLQFNYNFSKQTRYNIGIYFKFF
jgi:hypothetical protein